MPALDAYEDTLRELLGEALTEFSVPGAVVGVIRGDERSVVAAGTANVSTGIDTTPDTLFQIGSITKVYTASLVMQLVHAGLVELDEPVRGALQEFRVADDTATLSITPRQLLSHTSGIQGDHFLDCGRNPDAMWRYVSTLDDIGQLHAPDDMFSYCNAGYGVLGRLVEEATGDHFIRALRRRLVRPLGLERTVVLPEQAIVHRVATGHAWADGTHSVMPWTLSRFNLAVGGVVASAGDVLDFAITHARAGRTADGKQLIPPKAAADMASAQIDVPGSDDEWGLGWRLMHWGDVEVLAHDGDTIGQKAFLRVFPDADAAIVVLTNSPRGNLVAEAVLDEICPALVSVTPPPAPRVIDPAERPDPSAAHGIYERLHQRLAVAGGADNTLKMTVIPDDLFLLAGMRERTMVLQPAGDGRFLTTDPDTGLPTQVTFVEGEDGSDRPAYAYLGLRAHARIA